MKNGHILTAIDIGTTKICVIISQINDDEKIEIKGIGTSPAKGMSKGVVINIAEASRSIGLALKEAEEMAKMRAKNIYIGIAGDHIKSENETGKTNIDPNKSGNKKVTQAHIEDIFTDVRKSVSKRQVEQNREIIHIVPQSYTLDNLTGIESPLDMAGFVLEAFVHVVQADKSAIQNMKKCLDNCGHSRINSIFLEPIASSKSVLNEVELDLGAIIIDIGGGTTDIAIFYKKSIQFSAVIPIGGTQITSDISIGLRVSPENADEYKITYGNAMLSQVVENNEFEIEEVNGIANRKCNSKFISKIIESRMREIMTRASHLLNQIGNLDRFRAGITLTGGSSLLKNCDKLSQEIFKLPTKIGYPQLNNLVGTTDRLKNPIYSTVVGILYQAFAELKEQNRKKDDFSNMNLLIKWWKSFKAFLKDFL